MITVIDKRYTVNGKCKTCSYDNVTKLSDNRFSIPNNICEHHPTLNDLPFRYVGCTTDQNGEDINIYSFPVGIEIQ